MRAKILGSVLIAFVLMLLFVAALIATAALPPQDLTQYWAAAHLVGKNPYSAHFVSALEQASGLAVPEQPLVLKNPPWAIPFILPLGLFSYRIAFALWTVFSVVVVMSCTGAIWRLFGMHESIFSILSPLLFGPTIVLLLLGQWTVLVLLGITGFFIATEHRRDWVAGAFLLPVLGKPHIVLLLLLAIALWSIQTRRLAVIYSAALSLLASSALVLTLNRDIFVQFLARTRQVVSETAPYPNLGGMLYLISGKHALALVPQVAGVLWLVLYWFRHRKAWDWKTDGMLVLVCSIACSYYSYPYDEILVMPSLIAALAKGNLRIFIPCFIATNLGYAIYLFQVAGKLGLSYMFLSWTATAWLVTYAASTMLGHLQRRSATA